MLKHISGNFAREEHLVRKQTSKTRTSRLLFTSNDAIISHLS